MESIEFVSLDGEGLPVQPLEGCCVWKSGVIVLHGDEWEMSVSLVSPDQSPGDRVRERSLEFISAKFGTFLQTGENLELVEGFDNAPDIHLVEPSLVGDTIIMTIVQDLAGGTQEYCAIFGRAASQQGRGVTPCWKGAVIDCPS